MGAVEFLGVVKVFASVLDLLDYKRKGGQMARGSNVGSGVPITTQVAVSGLPSMLEGIGTKGASCSFVNVYSGNISYVCFILRGKGFCVSFRTVNGRRLPCVSALGRFTGRRDCPIIRAACGGAPISCRRLGCTPIVDLGIRTSVSDVVGIKDRVRRAVFGGDSQAICRVIP